MRRMNIHAAIVALGLSLNSLPAEEQKPERFTFGVTGLFSASREPALREAFRQIPHVTLLGIDLEAAEFTVEFIPKQAFPSNQPAQFAEALSQKVGQATQWTLKVRPRSMKPKASLEEVEVEVDILDCEACALAVYEMVLAVPGVERARVNRVEGKIKAALDPAMADKGKIESQLKSRNVPLKRNKEKGGI